MQHDSQLTWQFYALKWGDGRKTQWDKESCANCFCASLSLHTKGMALQINAALHRACFSHTSLLDHSQPRVHQTRLSWSLVHVSCAMFMRMNETGCVLPLSFCGITCESRDISWVLGCVRVHLCVLSVRIMSFNLQKLFISCLYVEPNPFQTRGILLCDYQWLLWWW